nr:High-affinity branched-chain amino acid transport system permease protein LivH [Cupriavidus sp.]
MGMGSWNSKTSPGAKAYFDAHVASQKKEPDRWASGAAWAGLEILTAAVAKEGLDRKAIRDYVADNPHKISEPMRLGEIQFAANKLLVFGLSLLFSVFLIVLLRMTLLGKGVRALMQSPVGAQLVGIDTQRLHPVMFGIGLGLSGIAGCLLSMAYTISPSMGEPYTITALIVITLGGFGSMGGALAGGLLLGVIEAVGMHFTNPSLKALLSYVVFISVLLLRPEGLFARKKRKA